MSSATLPKDRCFGIVPAAGESRRMGGQDKLLLPWGGETVIDRVLRAWTQSSVTSVIVIVRKENVALQKACRRWSAIELVIPERDPEDMKRSIQIGLGHVAEKWQPLESDRWMVAPADLPTLNAPLIRQLVEASRNSDSIVVPRFGDRRGHPVAFPWSLVPDVFRLQQDQGINQLLEDRSVQWLDLPTGQHPDDIDTPADYLRLSQNQ
jgi:molybdenum cofactor cytidylyltransferase